MRSKFHFAAAGMLGALVACSTSNLDYLKAGAVDADADSARDSSSVETSETPEVEVLADTQTTDAIDADTQTTDAIVVDAEAAVDVGPATPFTFDTVDQANAWTSEAAYPVGVDNVVQTWVGPDAGLEPDVGADADVGDGTVISGPALVYTFDCPSLDAPDAPDTSGAANGAGINIKFQAALATLTPYIGKTIHIVGSFVGAIADYQTFFQDTTSAAGYGVGAGVWSGFKTVTAGTTSGVIDTTSSTYTGMQTATDTAGKFGLQVNCGQNAGPVTIVINSVTFQ
jgi:hypothetical protein